MRFSFRNWLPALVLLLGMAIYLHGFVQSLPYQLEPDEPKIWIRVNALATTGKFIHVYPPLRLIELALEHRLLYLVTPPDSLAQPIYYVTGRYFSALYGMLMLALAYQAGRHLHSRAAGLATMLFLIAQPDAVHMGKLAKVDIFAWMFGMAALLLAFRVVEKERRWLIIPALLAGLAATASKYTMLPVLIVPGLVLLLFVPKTPLSRVIVVGAALLTVVGGIWLVLNPPGLLAKFFMSFHARQLYENETLRFVSLRQAWPELLEQLGPLNFWGILVAFPLAAVVWRASRPVRLQWMLLVSLLVMMAATFLALGFFRTNRAQDRYVVVLGFALLWGVTLAMLSRRWAAIALLVALVLVAPWLQHDWRYGTNLRKPDTRAITATWFIANVPEGVHIAVEYDRVEFDRGYGGFPSEKIFFVETITSVHEDSLENFARRGIEYLIADFRNINRGGYFDADTDNEAFLSQVETILDLDNPHSKGWRGPSRYVFRVPPIQQVPMHVFLGDAIIFKGYDLASDTVASGGTLDLVLYWAALREMDANYTVFAHLVDADGQLAAQLDGLPGDALHRTYDWWPGYFDWDEWPISIPTDVAPGVYTLHVGMYDADTVVRLPARDADGTPLGDSILLGEVVVTDGTDN